MDRQQFKVSQSLFSHPLSAIEARCSSVVRAFAHGGMDRRIDPSGCGVVALDNLTIELFLVPASVPRMV